MVFVYLLFGKLFAFTQTTIFSENIGTPSGTTIIASNTFQNTGLSFSGSADVRSTTPSSGYTSASGNGNVFITNTVGKDFQIAGISTVNYTNLSLSFGAYKSTTASNLTELTLEISTDGITFTTVSFPAQATGSGTANWRLISSITLPTSANGVSNLRIRFRQTSTTPQFRIDDIVLQGIMSPICNSPINLVFQVQPSNVLQDATMLPAVQVAATCSDGSIATSYIGNVTLSVNSPGCGYTSQTIACVNGVATFNAIVFSRSPQTGLTFSATASGLTGATSTSFNVTAPAGTPIVSTIIENNFDAIQTWGYTVGTPITIGSSGSTGTDIVGIVTEAGTGVLRKSYSVDNGSNEKGSKNTITFNNVSGLASYNVIDFTFKVLSFGSGTGAGMDSGEDFQLDISTDNGSNWIPILMKKGYADCLFPNSTTPQTSLSTSSSSIYSTGSCDAKSAFKLSLSGVTQFQFRITSQNNRTNENWGIDNVKLTGTTYSPGSAFNLPTVDVGSDIVFCKGITVQLNSNISSYQPSLTYTWTPSTGLSAVNISNPIVSGLSTSQTFTLQITDGNNCVSTDQIQLSVLIPPSIVLISPP